MTETQVIVSTDNLEEVNTLLASGYKVLTMLTANLILLSGTSAQFVVGNSSVNAEQLKG